MFNNDFRNTRIGNFANQVNGNEVQQFEEIVTVSTQTRVNEYIGVKINILCVRGENIDYSALVDNCNEIYVDGEKVK